MMLLAAALLSAFPHYAASTPRTSDTDKLLDANGGEDPLKNRANHQAASSRLLEGYMNIDELGGSSSGQRESSSEKIEGVLSKRRLNGNLAQTKKNLHVSDVSQRVEQKEKRQYTQPPLPQEEVDVICDLVGLGISPPPLQFLDFMERCL